MVISDPELKVVRFGSDDVIATSSFILSGIEAAAYGYEGSAEYVYYNGTLSPIGDGTYAINKSTNGFIPMDADEVDGLKSGGSVQFYGVTIDMSDMAPIAQNYYESYTYNDGYYSHGASYYDLYWQ